MTTFEIWIWSIATVLSSLILTVFILYIDYKDYKRLGWSLLLGNKSISERRNKKNDCNEN